MWGDEHFIYGIHKVVKNQVKRSSAPTYFYQFTYVNGTMYTDAIMNQKVNLKGNLHENDIK